MHLLVPILMIEHITRCQSKQNRICPKPVTKRLFLKDVHKDWTFKHDKCFAVPALQQKPYRG